MELQCELLHGTALVHNAHRSVMQAARLPRPMRRGTLTSMKHAHDQTYAMKNIQTTRQPRKGACGRTSSPASGRPLGVGSALGVPGAPSAGAASSGSAVKRRSSQLKGSHTRLQARRALLPRRLALHTRCSNARPSSVPATGQGHAWCRPSRSAFEPEQPRDSCPVAVRPKESAHLRVTPALSGGSSWPSARRSHSTAAPGSMSVCATWPCTCARAGRLQLTASHAQPWKLYPCM